MQRISYKLFLTFTILAVLGGILTMIPTSTASYPNMLGYRSLCTFTPAGTLLCFLAAGISCFIRSTFIKDQSGSPGKRLHKHRRSLLILGLVLIISMVFIFIFTNIRAEYLDDTSAASVTLK